MTETIFSKIIAGDLPCHKVYEDDLVLAFLDIAPLADGHTLVIPKRFARTMDQVDEESAAALGRALARVGRAVKAVTGCAAYNIVQNNEAEAHQAVMHVHFHVIPKPNPKQGLVLTWSPAKLDPTMATDLAAKLRAEIALSS